MSFLYPYFLFGLFGILIPIAIHFFNFHRYKKVYFSNVSILRDIEIRTRKQNNLYKLLLLLFRCLIVIFVVLMFAQPYVKNEEKALVQEGENVVVVFVDNSFSMQNASDKGIMLDKAKLKATEIVEAYSTTDKFCLLTMDLSGKEKHFTNKERFLQSLSEVEITSSSKMFSEVYHTAHKLANANNNDSKRCFFISDFQKGFIDEENLKEDSVENVFVPLQTKSLSNVYIDSLWIDNKSIMSQTALNLKVRVKNSSEKEIEKLPLKLIVDGEQVAVASVDLQADESKIVDLNFTVSRNGILHSKLSLLDSPVVFDNDFYFTLLVKEKINVLALNQKNPNPYLQRLFDVDQQINLDNRGVANPDYNAFSNYSLIILNSLQEINEGLSSELKKFVDNSGSLLIVPTHEMEVENINTFLAQMSLPRYVQLHEKNLRVSTFDEENYLFRDVFSSVEENISLPNVKKYFSFDVNSATAKQSVMSFSNGDDFLIISPRPTSSVYMLSVGLDTNYTDFVNNSLFVPLMWNMCALSQINTNFYYTIGNKDLISFTSEQNLNADDLFYIKSKNDSTEFIPHFVKNQSNIALNLYNQVSKSGNYDIYQGDSLVSGFSLNYSNRESLLEFYSDKELEEKFEKYSRVRVFDNRKLTETQFKVSDVEFSFTFLFIILALLCVLCEVLILIKLNKMK